MKKNKKIFSIIFLIIYLILNLNFSYAQKGPKPAPIPSDSSSPIKSGQDIMDLLGGILEYITIVFWILAIGAALYAAYLYLFSRGNEEKAKEARKMLWYAVIAMVIGLIAFSLPAIIKSILEIRGTRFV